MSEFPRVVKSGTCKECGKPQNFVEICRGGFSWDHLCPMSEKSKLEFDIRVLKVQIEMIKRKLEELE